MDDALRQVVDVGEPIVIRVRHELEPHQQRLLVALGAGWVVDERAPPCERPCGREECRVSDAPALIGRNRVGTRAVNLGQAAPVTVRRPFDPEPEVERREPKTTEQLRAEEQARADAQPITTYCGLCDWRFEGMVGEGREQARLHREAAHPETSGARRRGRGSGIGRWRRTPGDNEAREEAMKQVEQRRQSANGHVEGRELLERMDAGEPLGPGLEEASEPNEDGAGVSSSSDPGTAEPASTPAGGEAAELDPDPEEAGGASKFGRGALQLAVLDAIAAGEETATSIARALGKQDARGISGALQTLAKKGLLEKVSYGRYALTSEGRDAQAAGATLDSTRSEREPQADGKRPARRPSLDVAGTAPSRSDNDRVNVKGTGLTYRSRDEALVAADEIEADGERVADQARFDGNEQKAEQAIATARDLAEKIRAAAGGETTSDFPTSDEVEKQEEPVDPDAIALVPLDELTGRAHDWITAMRTEADRLDRRAAAFRQIADGLTVLADLEETVA